MASDAAIDDCVRDADSGLLARALRTVAAAGSIDARAAAALRFAILLKWGRFREARSIALDDLSPDALSPLTRRFLADATLDSGMVAMATVLYQNLLRLSPDQPAVQLALAKCQLLGGEAPQAVMLTQSIREAAHGDAELLADAMDVHAQALLKTGKRTEAEAAFREAIASAPARAATWANLGIVLWSEGRLEESIAASKAAFDAEILRYQGTKAFKLLADGYSYVGRDDEASAVFVSALRRQPDPDAHRNYADVLTRMGDLAKAHEHYEFRWLLPPLRELRPASVARTWQGQPLDGKRVLLRFEQGIGDNIQHLRYARHLQAMGATTVIGRFSDVVDCCDGISEVASSAPESIDFLVDMASLPRLFGTTTATIPSNIPYITPNAADVDRWARRIAGSDGLKVGLVWAGNPEHSRDAERSVAFARLLPLFDVDGVVFYNLQKSAGVESQTGDAFGENRNLASEFADFGDTAAAIANLDLVICVDTSVAHLAGAMGKETWMLLAKPSDPRWMQGLETPWYPTMKLFRQRERGDWGEVIARVRAALERRVTQVAPLHSVVPFVPHPPQVPQAWIPATTRWPGHQRGLSAIADTRFGLMQYLPDEPLVGDALAWYGEHLQHQIDLLAGLIEPRATLLEVAAGIGSHTLALAAMAGANGHLILYEDDAIKRQVLRQNLSLHNVGNATLMRRRIGAISEEQSKCAPPSEETLDDLQLDHLDWIKIADGGRAIEVLQHADETIWRLRPRIFAAADDGAQLETLVLRARDLGYRCWASRTPLYNQANVNARDGDIFDGRVALALLAIPEESGIEIATAPGLDEL